MIKKRIGVVGTRNIIRCFRTCPSKIVLGKINRRIGWAGLGATYARSHEESREPISVRSAGIKKVFSLCRNHRHYQRRRRIKAAKTVADRSAPRCPGGVSTRTRRRRTGMNHARSITSATVQNFQDANPSIDGTTTNKVAVAAAVIAYVNAIVARMFCFVFSGGGLGGVASGDQNDERSALFLYQISFRSSHVWTGPDICEQGSRPL
jgi:hypothetical protein